MRTSWWIQKEGEIKVKSNYNLNPANRVSRTSRFTREACAASATTGLATSNWLQNASMLVNAHTTQGVSARSAI